MLRYSLPLIPHQVSGYLATLISKIFLNASGSLAVVGLYGIATQFSAIVDVFQDSVSRAYRPWLFERLNDPKRLIRTEITKISNILVCLYSLVFVGVGLFSQEIIYIMTASSYHGAWMVVPILVISISLRSIYYFYVAHCFYYQETARKIFVASISANFCNIFAASLLVPRFGMYGSAIASLISISINIVFIFFINMRNGDIGYKLGSFVKRLIFSWIFIAIGVLPSYLIWPEGFKFVNILYKVLISLIYITILWFINRADIYSFVGVKNGNELMKMLIKERKKL